jgi:flagellar basal body-associated protein FliL
MADAPAKKKDDKDAAEKADGQKSGKMKIIGVVGAIMLLEGVAVFGAMKFLGAGAGTNEAAELQVAATQPEEFVELEVLKLGAPNNREGKPVLWNIEVVVRVRAADSEMIQKSIDENQNTLKDRFSRILRGADPEHLKEPGLETLRRQAMFELGRVLGGEGKIEEVLIPKCTPYPIGF